MMNSPIIHHSSLITHHSSFIVHHLFFFVPRRSERAPTPTLTFRPSLHKQPPATHKLRKEKADAQRTLPDSLQRQRTRVARAARVRARRMPLRLQALALRVHQTQRSRFCNRLARKLHARSETRRRRPIAFETFLR